MHRRPQKGCWPLVSATAAGWKDFLDYTVIGDAVNLACRLEENAKAGEILIAQATYDEVKDAVEVAPLDPIRVKGKGNPIPIYRVLGLVT